MFLKSIAVAGVKCFEHLEIAFPHQQRDYSGWIVLLGGNGVGKSTLLQAMALALVGPLTGQRLFRPEGWVRDSRSQGRIEASVPRGDADSNLGQPRQKPYEVSYAITGKQEVTIDGQPYDQPQLVHTDSDKEKKALASGPYGAKRPGWFCCGYGPFRRLSGGDSQSRVVYSAGKEYRFATLFYESAALTQCEDWLSGLYSRSIDPHNPDAARAKADLEIVRSVIDHLLPGSVRIDRIDTGHVYFQTIGDVVVAIPELSDGYRSFLSLAIDMLRHVLDCGLPLQDLVVRTENTIQITIEGVVLIDEVDAHLHPIWQRNIGFRLQRIFPKIQFIVTSHSSFVAQVASDNGLIVLKPNPTDGTVEARQPVESVRGWRVDEILTSDLFGLTETRDEETEQLIRRHAELIARRTWNQLDKGEQRELTQIEEQLGQRLTAPGESAEEQARFKKMDAFVDETLRQLAPFPPKP